MNQSQWAESINKAVKKLPPTYETFERWYSDRLTTTEQRERLRSLYPKLTAKFMLLDHPGALREGSTVFVIVRKHSRTGYSKSISLYTFTVRTDAGYNASPDKPQLQPLTLTYNVAQLMGYNVHNFEGRDVLRTDDYAQEFVAHLSQLLFGVDKASALNCEVL